MSNSIKPETERYSDPHRERLTEVHDQRVAVLSWTDTTGAHVTTIDAATVLGSAESSKVRIADPSVSGVHVELTPTDDGIVIRDLESTNGTFRDTMRIERVVAPGDFRLRLGRVEVAVRQPTETVSAALWPEEKFAGLVGRSVQMRALFDQLFRVAPTDETVLIHGDTGTGKEGVAGAIHDFSKRARKPFTVIDCSALPSNLLESELFGHAKGAFSGAFDAHKGAFEEADGGTLFLDEIGELPLEMQPKLLRALEAREIRRLGETNYRKVDVRVIAASHRDLREMVNLRGFRADLYFRLAVVPVHVAPLRKRPNDVPLLVERFLEERPEMPKPSIEQMGALMKRPWIGNVRELRNVVALASVDGWDRAIAEDPGAAAGAGEPERPVAKSTALREAAGQGGEPALDDPDLPPIGGFKAWRAKWIKAGERKYLTWLLAKYGPNIMRAAVAAGIDNSYLRKMMKEFGM